MFKASFEKSADEIARIRRFADSAIWSEAGVRSLIAEVIRDHPFASVEPFQMIGLFRVRPNNEQPRFSNIKDLWYPPRDSSKINRFNFSGQPRWYLGGNAASCAAEIGIVAGQRYTIAEVVFERDLPFLLLEMYESNSNRLSGVARQILSVQSEKLADALTTNGSRDIYTMLSRTTY